MSLDKFKPSTSTQRSIGQDGIGDKKGSHTGAKSQALTSRTNAGPKLAANTERLRSEGKLYKSKGMASDSPFRNVTHVGKTAVRGSNSGTRKLTPLRGPAAYDKNRESGDSKVTHFAPSKQHDGYGWKDGHKHKGLGSS